MTNNGAVFWLWVDPRREPGWAPATFDLGAFLARAVALFQAKERWAGELPNAVRVHPDQAANGLKPAAEVLGLRVVSDPKVAAGAFWLGVATGEEAGEQEQRTEQLRLF